MKNEEFKSSFSSRNKKNLHFLFLKPVAIVQIYHETYSYGDSPGFSPGSLFIHKKLEPYMNTNVQKRKSTLTTGFPF